MYFLSTTLFEQEKETERTQLCGAVLTSFNPAEISARPVLSMVTMDELSEIDRAMCAGFTINEDGVLLSDSSPRRVTGSAQISFVKNEIDMANSSDKTLIDFLKDCLNYNCRVLQNYEKALSGEELPITIPVESFKVSNSSFNIYASYQREDKSFRTMSLIDIEENKAKEFCVAIPAEYFSGMLMNYKSLIALKSVKGLEEYTICKVDLPLQPFPVLTGEAFCNYLAYNVAYYKIGLQVIDVLLSDTKFKSDTTANKDTQYAGTPKTPAPSLSIESEYTNHALNQIMSCMDDSTLLVELVQSNGEANITMNWMQEIQKASNSAVNGELAKTCIALRHDCKSKYLHFALELLAQRLCINQVNTFSLPFGSVLKGGGVNGCSLKRTFG